MNSVLYFNKEKLNEYFLFLNALSNSKKVKMASASFYLMYCFQELTVMQMM